MVRARRPRGILLYACVLCSGSGLSLPAQCALARPRAPCPPPLPCPPRRSIDGLLLRPVAVVAACGARGDGGIGGGSAELPDPFDTLAISRAWQRPPAPAPGTDTERYS